jgi:hypoxanthine phosphoribosyltransferase
MDVEKQLIGIVGGVISGIILIIGQKFLLRLIQSPKIITAIKRFKLIIIHIIISLLLLQLSEAFTVIVRLSLILGINFLIMLTWIKDSQVNGIKYITRKDNPNLKIGIYKLKWKNKNDKLMLTWETFGKGIEMLSQAIHAAAGIDPNVIFGVNEAGIMIASYLSFQNRYPLGIIKTGGHDSKSKREIIQFDCPENIKNPGTIAIVDSEIKSGGSNKDIFDEVRKKYKNARIIYIVLVGVVRKEPESVLDFGWDITDNKYKPYFVSFYIEEPGFEPPGKIR